MPINTELATVQLCAPFLSGPRTCRRGLVGASVSFSIASSPPSYSLTGPTFVSGTSFFSRIHVILISGPSDANKAKIEPEIGSRMLYVICSRIRKQIRIKLLALFQVVVKLV